MKLVSKETQWGQVARELGAEHIKLQSYDPTLLELCGTPTGKHIFDYGPGPGILASALSAMDARVQAYDISQKMRTACAAKIGAENVFAKPSSIPSHAYDTVICNLVQCINSEDEVRRINTNVHRIMKPDGVGLVGFCNPRIFDIAESAVDIRHPTGQPYFENHCYEKTKKEGNYKIIEWHRPLAWYQQEFINAGFEIVAVSFTPAYTLDKKLIQDYVILKIAKTKAERMP